MYRLNRRNGARLARPLRVALVADLHSRSCEGALQALAREKIDIIAVCGDLMERYATRDAAEALRDLEEQMRDFPEWKRAVYRAIIRVDGWLGRVTRAREAEADNRNAYQFLRGAAKIAPTFYALGNHERGVTAEDEAKIANTGAILLNNREQTVNIGALRVLVGGLSSRRDENWLARFSRMEADVKILLCHHPEYYGKYVPKSVADAVLSGHAHGGQWRLFGHPFFAPGQGLFPRYASGVYDGTLVVSRGLSNTAHVPRFGNKMELPIVEIR